MRLLTIGDLGMAKELDPRFENCPRVLRQREAISFASSCERNYKIANEFIWLARSKGQSVTICQDVHVAIHEITT